MPRLVRGHQPPRAAAGQRGTCAQYQYNYAPVEGTEVLVMYFYVLNYSARGGGSDQGCQNGYKSGLPSVAFFLTLYMQL